MLFWEDTPTTKPARGDVPSWKKTGWRPPTELPDLSAAPVIAVDVETYDPDLLEFGPGWARGVGHVVGVSIATHDGAWYLPIRHTLGENLPESEVFAWLRRTLGNSRQPKVGANLLYDVGWLRQEGVIVRGPLYDVQFAEALIDEAAPVNLDALGAKYVGEGKTTNDLYTWCAFAYGGKPTSEQRKNIWRAPTELVGPYAEQDAALPLKVLRMQWPILEKYGLLRVFDMECRLISLLIEMRFQGVRVDVVGAERLRKQFLARERELHAKLDAIAGTHVDINSAPHLAHLFDKMGLPYPKTEKGNPSFTGAFLAKLDHPIGALIREIRKYEKARVTFLESYILDAHVNGRVYGQFHPLRGDEDGTRSGRFSSSTPNLQNIPARDEEMAPMIRGLFLPDEGHAAWRSYDYSQIEYRFFLHYAVGKGADEARAQFCAHPNTDYHEFALDLVAPVAGWDISTKEKRKKWRKPVKNINFGLIYGMGVKKLAAMLGMRFDEAKRLFDAYHSAIKFAKPTIDAAMREAEQNGYITTILGRRSWFDLWEPCDTFAQALPREEALRRYGTRIRRAHTHKALNRRLQGSAADLMKLAMLKCWEDGIFDETGVPRLTVHDELDFSDPGGKDAAFREMKHVMETAIPLLVPVKADAEIGPDWGHLHDLEDAA